jgi:hypothetical protein
MWLITTLIAAIVVTAAWHIAPRKYKLNFLSLMLWGSSLMILVDHIIGYEGGAFLELETEGLITLLGIAMLIPILIFWEIVLITTTPKEKIIGGK